MAASSSPLRAWAWDVNVIAAAVIGGTVPRRVVAPRSPAALVGAILMETLKKGLTMMSIAAEWQFVVTGIVLLLAVVIDNLRRIRENAA